MEYFSSANDKCGKPWNIFPFKDASSADLMVCACVDLVSPGQRISEVDRIFAHTGHNLVKVGPKMTTNKTPASDKVRSFKWLVFVRDEAIPF